MKILTAHQIRQVEIFTIQKQEISSWDLMERAALAFAEALSEYITINQKVIIVCGRGNNGGDGLAIARILYKWAFHPEVYLLQGEKPLTPETETNLKLLKDLNIDVYDLNDPELFTTVAHDAVIIDALFGSGLNRPLQGLPARIADAINKLTNTVFAVDVPSGLFSDGPNNSEDAIIEADFTFSFQLPRLSFFLCDNEGRIGDLQILPIELDEVFIQNMNSDYHTIDKNEVAGKIRIRKKCSHKGTYGHALIAAGSLGKMGAAVLSARSCLRSGAGLITAWIPSSGVQIMQSAFPEAMVIQDDNSAMLTGMPEVSKYDAIGIGPGIGTDVNTAEALKLLLGSYNKPIILDADALNILSLNIGFFHSIPENSILTPHPKEFDRLTQSNPTQWERMKAATQFSGKYHIILILKGAYTSVHLPDGRVHINTTGNSGMATAGSGDVLTGIITGLLAQGYTPEDAALIGVHLHGTAGDLAAEEISQQAMIAGDIIEHIGAAYRFYDEIRN